MNGNDRIKYLKSDNPAYEPISGSDLEGFARGGESFTVDFEVKEFPPPGWNPERRKSALHGGFSTLALLHHYITEV